MTYETYSEIADWTGVAACSALAFLAGCGACRLWESLSALLKRRKRRRIMRRVRAARRSSAKEKSREA